ncbi:MAG: acetyl-coenzyme-A carboxylase, partial [Watsoniomyces obsoletus]
MACQYIDDADESLGRALEAFPRSRQQKRPSQSGLIPTLDTQRRPQAQKPETDDELTNVCNIA